MRPPKEGVEIEKCSKDCVLKPHNIKKAEKGHKKQMRQRGDQ